MAGDILQPVNTKNPIPNGFQTNQQTQTSVPQPLQVSDTGAQYSSPSDSSDSNSSDSESDIVGTENITVAKQYLNRHSLSSEDIYTAPIPPNKRFQTSTLEQYERKPEKEPSWCLLEEIVNHRALHIPPVDIIVAPGRWGSNARRGLQRVQAMVGRGRNQNQALQGADPALVQILQMMQNRDANMGQLSQTIFNVPKRVFYGPSQEVS